VTRKDNSDVEAALWMLAQLAPDTQNKVRRRLALRLDPPLSPIDRRQRELRFAAELLRPIAPRRGWSFPYTPRRDYDERRPPDAPSSASLTATYGSWSKVCLQAYSLLEEGSLRPHLVTRQPGRKPSAYNKDHAAAALQECAGEISRAPSRRAYTGWRAAVEKCRPRMRRHPCASLIARLYAHQGGWLAALEDAGLVAPPPMTVRVVVGSEEEVVELLAAVRARDLIAAHAGNNKWFEVRGTFALVRRNIVECARSLAVTKVTLWEPATTTLERVDLQLDLPR
jgi:hypothetical protein